MEREFEIRASKYQIDEIVESLESNGFEVKERSKIKQPQSPDSSGFSPEDVKNILEVVVIIIKGTAEILKLKQAIVASSKDRAIEIADASNSTSNYKIISKHTSEDDLNNLFG